jgi:hypothetical protein
VTRHDAGNRCIEDGERSAVDVPSQITVGKDAIDKRRVVHQDDCAGTRPFTSRAQGVKVVVSGTVAKLCPTRKRKTSVTGRSPAPSMPPG